MPDINFEVPGKPISKLRPVTVQCGYGVNTFTPKKSKDFAHLVNVLAKQAAWDSDFKKVMLPNPVELHLTFYVKGKTQPVSKPDVNNLAGNVLDGLEGALYENDCQVVKLHAKKVQCAVEGTLISLFTIEESECLLEYRPNGVQMPILQSIPR
jgi:Holliday junction resolvase RusA-like endonuclease